MHGSDATVLLLLRDALRRGVRHDDTDDVVMGSRTTAFVEHRTLSDPRASHHPSCSF